MTADVPPLRRSRAASRRSRVALEELKRLDQIISRHDELIAKNLALSITLVAGLSLAYLSRPLGVNAVGFFLVCLSIVVSFFLTTVIYKVAQDRAIERAGTVEAQVRDRGSYDGPSVTRSLRTRTGSGTLLRAARKGRIWGPCCLLLVTVLVIALQNTTWLKAFEQSILPR